MKAIHRVMVFLIPALWIGAVQETPFFWDTVQLASKHAHFFYENHLKWAALPPAIDSGHPPFLGYYLAVVWSFFGKTLTVSHWAMYPFLVATTALILALGRRVAVHWRWWWLPVIWLDPVWSGQAALVSPDTILATGFLGAVWAARANKPVLLSTFMALLCIVSMRGMMTTAALSLWLLASARARAGEIVFRVAPGAAVAALFLGWHYATTGWIGHFEGSSWAAAFERTDAAGVLRNAAVLVWRWTDQNRFTGWIFVGAAIYLTGWKAFYRRHRDGVWLLAATIIFLAPSALLYKNLSAHRYFLPVFLSLHLLIFELVVQKKGSDFLKKSAFATWALLMAAGHFWIYPKGVSMDWDCTLAHLSYHPLREKAVAFMDQYHILQEQTGSAFPNLNTGEHLLLNGDYRQMQPLDLPRQPFVMVSNVFNDVDMPQYDTLQQFYTVKAQWEQAGVWIALWQQKQQQ